MSKAVDAAPDPAIAALAERIARARKARGLSRAALAEAVGTSPPIIGRYERAEMTPSVATATRIADALEVSVDYLVGRANDVTRDAAGMRRLEDIAALPPERRDVLLDVVDAYLRDVRTRETYLR